MIARPTFPALLPALLPPDHPLAALDARDADASARISQIETAKGSPMTGPQKAALDTFIRAEKSAGRWPLLKQLYLPVWASAEANAINLRDGSVGSFVGTVTHGAGYVQGDGSTGYFRSGSDLLTLGLTPASGYLFFLALTDQTAVAGAFLGSGAGGTSLTIRENPEGTIQVLYSDFVGAGVISATAAPTGIVSFSRFGGDRAIARRATSGRAELARATGADANAITPAPLFYGARNNTYIAGDFAVVAQTDARLGAYGVGLGLSGAADSEFTANLKTLWETVTGLTLP